MNQEYYQNCEVTKWRTYFLNKYRVPLDSHAANCFLSTTSHEFVMKDPEGYLIECMVAFMDEKK